MAGLLDIPEEVLLKHLFPQLGHNDILRLRRVCKMTKDLANNYLWTPKKGHQGKWTLEIMPTSKDKNLQAFLQKQLSPPSRLHVNLHGGEAVKFFEDPNLEEFIRIYSKYVTNLEITRIEIPFMSAKEIGFFESLVNLEVLDVFEIKTGGAAKFQKKMETDGSRLIPSTFLKLKSFKCTRMDDCSSSFSTFVRGLKCLESFSRFTAWDISRVFRRPNTNTIAFLTRFIEEDVGNKLQFIDWNRNPTLPPYLDFDWNRREILQLFALCSDKGIKIKGLPVHYLEVLLCNVNGVVDKTEVYDEDTKEFVYGVDYQRNSFVANVIHSLVGLDGVAFLMELPYLEELLIKYRSQVRLWQRHGNIQWPNLKKMDISVADSDVESFNLVNFLCGRVERPKLEEFALRFRGYGPMFGMTQDLPLPCPSNLVRSFSNLRKLTIQDCAENCHFFATLWEGLRLLEDVELVCCYKLGDEGFIGNYRAVPIFLKLEKLRHLCIGGIHQMRGFTDLAFWEVFRHMKLESLKLSGEYAGRPLYVTVEGIKALLTGKFAESIEKIDFEQLILDGMSADEKRELKSRFRSSQML